jgi:hypothetical protein
LPALLQNESAEIAMISALLFLLAYGTLFLKLVKNDFIT